MLRQNIKILTRIVCPKVTKKNNTGNGANNHLVIIILCFVWATVGNLPMENSRATKFLLDRGVRVVSILTLTNYCVSLLVKGGLEIPCRVELYMSPTVKNKQLIDIYRNYVDLLYYEREISSTVG